MKATVGKSVRLRECPFRELPLHLKAFHKEGNHFAGAPNEDIVQNHLTLALLNVF